MKTMFSGKAMSVAVVLAGLVGGSMVLAAGGPAGHACTD